MSNKKYNSLNNRRFDIYKKQKEFFNKINLKNLNCTNLEAIQLFSDYIYNTTIAQETDKGVLKNTVIQSDLQQ